MILRDWECLNPDCGKMFESPERAPHCPKCRCAKTRWSPSGGHMKSAKTVHADSTLRDVANRFGLSNLKSARQGEAAHPGLQQPKAGNEKLFHGIPWSAQGCTSGFAKDMPTQKISATTHHKFKASGARLPTKVVGVDNRKIPL